MKRFLGVVLTFFVFSISYSQSYTYRNYSVPDGLPQTQPWSIFQDRKGFIWICTKGGLARFDGLNFQTFTTEDGLNDNFAYDVNESPDGTLYVANQRGLNYLKNGKFFSIDYSKEYLDARDEVITSADKQIYYVRNQKLYQIKNFRMIVPRNGIDSLGTFFNQDSKQYLQSFFYSRNYIYRFDHSGNLQKYTDRPLKNLSFFELNGLPYAQNDQKGILYLIKPTGIIPLIKITGKSITTLNKHDFGRGYLQLYAENLLRFNHERVESLPINIQDSHFFLCDRQDNLWYGTQQGLTEITSQAFRNMDSKQYNFPDIYNVVEDRDGSIWFFSFDEEILRLKDDKILNLSYLKKNIGNDRIYSARARDFDGGILLGSGMGLVKYKNSNLFRVYPQVHGAILYGLNDTLKNRILFCGQQEGFFYIDSSGKKHGFKNRDPLKNTGLITSALIDKFNNYWISGKQGISILKNDSVWVDLPCDSLKFDKGAISMYRDSLGNIWLGGTDGLYYYDYKNFRKVGSGFFDNQIGALKKSKHNTLFIGSINGIGLLDLNSFYKEGKVNIRFFNQDNGFSGIECRHNATFTDHEGNLWICTSNKVVRFNPDHLKINNIPPPLYFRNISFLNKNQEWESVKNFDVDSSGYFTTSKRNLRIEFVALDFSVPKRVQYKYRMEGFQNEWSSPQNSRHIDITDISPGNYTFNLLASNGDGVWMKNPATLSLVIIPFFYETAWFKTLSVGASLSLFFLFGYILSRRRLIRHKKQELQKKELARIQFRAISNLVDPHFIFNVLNSIGTVVFNNDREKAYDYFTKFARLIRSSLEYSDVHVRPLQEEIYFIKNFLDLEKLRFKDKFHYQIDVEDNVDRDIPVPKMLLQTFSENAIRHGLMPKADTGHLVIRIRKKDGMIQITVEDDGIGRKKAAELNTGSTGKGISLIRQYIDIFNGFNDRKIEFTIEDITLNGEAGGTRVTLHIPDNYRYETEN